MTSSPLVSIGMPVYNGERFIGEAIESVQAQTYRNIEIVICDNSSTDRTTEICLTYAARDGRIRYYKNGTNIGAARNFFRVFKLTTGDFFLWACADDIRPRMAVENLVAALLNNPLAVKAHGPVIVVTEGGEVEVSNKMWLTASDPVERVRAFTKGITHNGMNYGMYRRATLGKVMYGEHFGKDYLLCLQMCMLGPIEYTATPMVIYRQRTVLSIDPIPVRNISDNPMYRDVPIRFTHLLMDCGLRRWKCWTVLIMGSYYLGRLSGVTLGGRLRAISAHMWSFSARYRRKLARELLFQLFAPIAWLSKFMWRLARYQAVSSRLAWRLKTRLLRSRMSS